MSRKCCTKKKDKEVVRLCVCEHVHVNHLNQEQVVLNEFDTQIRSVWLPHVVTLSLSGPLRRRPDK